MCAATCLCLCLCLCESPRPSGCPAALRHTTTRAAVALSAPVIALCVVTCRIPVVFPQVFKAGDAVEVFSRSKNEWYPGKVKAVEAGEATVLYFVGVSDYYWDHPPHRCAKL